MKKLTKLLSVFLIAGAVGTGVAGISACNNKTPETPEHQHTADTTWQKDANKHWHNCTENDGARLNEGDHVWDNDQDTTCNTCGYERTVTPPAPTGFVIPAAADELIIEGYGETEVQLSTEKTSHAIDKSAIKVYLNDGAGKTKGTEVPAANLEISIKDPSNHDCEWTGLKADGAYNISVKVIDATVESGSQMILDDFKDGVTITVHNAIISTSLALKTGTTTQAQSVQDKMTSTWAYEVTRENGEKEDVTAQVTVTGLDTNTIVTDATANLSCTIGTLTVTGTVKYSITASTALHTKTYAANFAAYPDTDNDDRTDDAVVDGNGNKMLGGVATGTKFIDGNGTTLTMMADKSDMKQKVQPNSTSYEEDSKYFYKRFAFGGTAFTAPDKGGKAQANRYLKLDVDGPAKLTIYYSASSANRGVAVFDSTTPFDALSLDSEPLAKGIITATNTVHKLEVSLPAAGAYFITQATSGDIYFHYIEVSTEFEDENGSDITLAAGENVARKIELATPETIPALKVGSKFTTAITGITVIKSNTVNCAMTKEAATDWATAATYKMGTTEITADTDITADMLGKQTITVTYGGLTANYEVTVEAAVDGITGVNASLASTVNTQVATADGKVTITKNDIVVEKVGVNADASVTSYTVKVDSVALTDSVELAVGPHTVEVTATVEAGTASADFTDTFTITVSVKPAEGALTNVVVDSTIVSTVTGTLTAQTDLVDNSNGKVFITASESKTVIVEADAKTYNDKDFTHRIKLGGTGAVSARSIGVEVKQGATIVFYAISSSASAARDVQLLNADGTVATATATLDGATMGQVGGKALHKVEYTVTAAGTYYFGSVASGLNVYGVEIIYS